jgi:hypothetical protein
LEGHVQQLGWSFPMLETVGNHSERESLDAGNSFIPGLAVAEDTGQRWDLGDPPPVFFAL